MRDMATFDHNLLTFCEDAMMASLNHVPQAAPVTLMDIPKQARNPVCPVRFLVELNLGPSSPGQAGPVPPAGG